MFGDDYDDTWLNNTIMITTVTITFLQPYIIANMGTMWGQVFVCDTVVAWRPFQRATYSLLIMQCVVFADAHSLYLFTFFAVSF